MKRGTIGILCISAAIGLGTALMPPIINDRDCQARVAAWTSETGNVQSATLPFVKASPDEAQWKPLCHRSRDSFNFAILGLSLFLTVFIGSYVCWLAGRAGRIAMRRFSGARPLDDMPVAFSGVVWSARNLDMLHAESFERRTDRGWPVSRAPQMQLQIRTTQLEWTPARSRR